MIDNMFESLERSHEEMQTEEQERKESIRRSLQASRARFEIIIANRQENARLDNRMDRMTEYAAIALGSFEDPWHPDRSSQLLAVPIVKEQINNYDTAVEYPKPIKTEFSFNFQSVNNVDGPDKYKMMGEYTIPASDEGPQTIAVTLDSAKEFEQVTVELMDYINREKPGGSI